MKRGLVLLVGLLVVAIAAPASAAGSPKAFVKKGEIAQWPGFDPAQPSDSHGGNLPGECSAIIPDDNVCCEFLGDPTCDDDPGSYNGGDTICISQYWVETVDPVPPGDWIATWSTVLRIPGPRIIPVFVNEEVNFGPIPGPGTYNFCVAYSLTLPDPPRTVAIQHGQRAVTPGGSLPPTITGAFSLSP